jgi:hypothetical protein
MGVQWQFEMLGGLRAAGTREAGRGDRVLTRFRTPKTGALLDHLAATCCAGARAQRTHPRDRAAQPHRLRHGRDTVPWLPPDLTKPSHLAATMRHPDGVEGVDAASGQCGGRRCGSS